MNEGLIRTTGDRVFFRVYAAVLVVFLLAPIILPVVLSISEDEYLVFPPRGFSLKWYVKILSDADFISSLLLSLRLAVVVMVVSVSLGLLGSFGLVRGNFFGRDLMKAFILSPIIFPTLVTGIAILQFVSMVKSHWTFTHLVIGHVVITLPYAVRVISAALIALNENTEDAARVLGANGVQTLRRVVLPQLKKSIFIAATFCFILSFDNFPVTLWLADAEHTPLPLLAYRYIQRFFDPSVAALSSVMIVISVAAIVFLQRQFGIRKAAGF